MEKFKLLASLIFKKLNESIAENLIKFNQMYLVLISSDLDDYISGYKSPKRLFLAIITKVALISVVIKFILCATIKEARYFKNCMIIRG